MSQSSDQITASPVPELEQTNGTQTFAWVLLALSMVAAIGAGFMFRTLTAPAPFPKYAFNLNMALVVFASGALTSAGFFVAAAVVARLNRIIALLKAK